MFANLAKKLNALLVTTDERDRDAYLASSVDFADLERRMDYLEMNHQPFTLYSAGVPHDWRD
ncbi:DUF3563 family protein [Paraburkholderia sp. DHOC27]|uniref:DUF3563 family protein n=1 Tax=Paraburkholderia sp. DHOC27 TaxID=2303330 RepID=UPI000E3DBE50|nr:DUF3563 family protein [Paraburkholderia sp. DHOC27]RFU45165.1 DUF3563 domain-containing protein [Paraburkholderia sp. DHOC27]